MKGALLGLGVAGILAAAGWGIYESYLDYAPINYGYSAHDIDAASEVCGGGVTLYHGLTCRQDIPADADPCGCRYIDFEASWWRPNVDNNPHPEREERRK